MAAKLELHLVFKRAQKEASHTTKIQSSTPGEEQWYQDSCRNPEVKLRGIITITSGSKHRQPAPIQYASLAFKGTLGYFSKKLRL